ncbi:hypothetical protein INR49_010539 [Caranx melampygus]|nr:hypothetical protein INR49_010539 [Caranx melampygus]
MAVRKKTLAYMLRVVTELTILHMTRPKGQRKSNTVSTAQKGKVRTNWRSVSARLITKQSMEEWWWPRRREWSRKRARKLPTSPRTHTTRSVEDSLERMWSQQLSERLKVARLEAAPVPLTSWAISRSSSSPPHTLSALRGPDALLSLCMTPRRENGGFRRFPSRFRLTSTVAAKNPHLLILQFKVSEIRPAQFIPGVLRRSVIVPVPVILLPQETESRRRGGASCTSSIDCRERDGTEGQRRGGEAASECQGETRLMRWQDDKETKPDNSVVTIGGRPELRSSRSHPAGHPGSHLQHFPQDSGSEEECIHEVITVQSSVEMAAPPAAAASFLRHFHGSRSSSSSSSSVSPVATGTACPQRQCLQQ